ncbi:hypothetical protein O6H91_02G111700 [Diphasiastrum complanatum]|uniref:Uncharacterized protein n=1 Tax=Diphasiastrum complanatum TaxID=34168 RepID=A0ACC2EJS5_DIPCM|nr:hypothetical protein O6H91_02G111700 [Diphasiastrum complanatum]
MPPTNGIYQKMTCKIAICKERPTKRFTKRPAQIHDLNQPATCKQMSYNLHTNLQNCTCKQTHLQQTDLQQTNDLCQDTIARKKLSIHLQEAVTGDNRLPKKSLPQGFPKNKTNTLTDPNP